MTELPPDAPGGAPRGAPIPILALDVPGAREAFELIGAVPDARFVKVGLQLFTAAGPDVVRELIAGGRRVFLDLKLHDIPNTVAQAVRSAADLGVELLTVHTAGGRPMLEAAQRAAGSPESAPRLLGVTVLTSVTGPELAEVWGREGIDPEAEVVRLARLASETGLHGVVASVHEARAIRSRVGEELRVLTPGIRLPGDLPGDQARVASPAEAAAAGADYIVIGRAVTASAEPARAFQRVLADLHGSEAELARP